MYKIQKSRQKISGTKSDLIKVVEYKVNTQKSIIFLYTINKQVELKIKRIIIFIVLASKNEILTYKQKYIYIQNLYEENYRTVIKK